MDYNEIYRYVFERRDESRIEKLINARESGQMTPVNYWDIVRSLCANVKSDHAIKRWQILAECFYNLYIMEA